MTRITGERTGCDYYSDETTDKTATVNALVENNTETLETSFDQIALSSRKIIITAGKWCARVQSESVCG